MIDFDCSQCRKRLRVSGQADGRKARCPFCRGINHVSLSATLRRDLSFGNDEYEVPGRYGLRYETPKSAGLAAILEAGPGLLQVFGLGHIYAGNIVTGLFFLFGYWFAVAIVLFFGFLTCGIGTVLIIPLWFLTMLVSTLTAAASCGGR